MLEEIRGRDCKRLDGLLCAHEPGLGQLIAN